jgi:hypothetical protein
LGFYGGADEDAIEGGEGSRHECCIFLRLLFLHGSELGSPLQAIERSETVPRCHLLLIEIEDQ